MKLSDIFKYKKELLIAFLSVALLCCFCGCGNAKPYNTVHTIKAEQIIKGKSYLRGYEEHVISDKQGNVYRIFQSPKEKTDSVYKVVKRMSFNRERSVQFYYKIVNPKKVKG